MSGLENLDNPDHVWELDASSEEEEEGGGEGKFIGGGGVHMQDLSCCTQS